MKFEGKKFEEIKEYPDEAEITPNQTVITDFEGDLAQTEDQKDFLKEIRLFEKQKIELQNAEEKYKELDIKEGTSRKSLESEMKKIKLLENQINISRKNPAVLKGLSNPEGYTPRYYSKQLEDLIENLYEALYWAVINGNINKIIGRTSRAFNNFDKFNLNQIQFMDSWSKAQEFQLKQIELLITNFNTNTSTLVSMVKEKEQKVNDALELVARRLEYIGKDEEYLTLKSPSEKRKQRLIQTIKERYPKGVVKGQLIRYMKWDAIEVDDLLNELKDDGLVMLTENGLIQASPE